MGDLSNQLVAAAAEVAALEEQREARIDPALVRRIYRRGYLAGRAAARRGAPLVTNPERHARTEVREMLHGS